MKCAKCGFISFDYLSTCKKCGINLNQARTVLGFSDVKPAPPPFLKALVEEGGPAGPEVAVRQPRSVDDAASRIERAVAEGPALTLASSPVQDAAPVAAAVAEHQDEWAMDPKWLEEFDKKPMEDAPDVDDLLLELVDDEIPARGVASDRSGPMGSAKELPPMDLHADESLDDLVFEDFSPAADEDLLLTEASNDLDLFAQPATKPAQPAMELEGDLDDLVLELGDDTLDFSEMELEEAAAER